MVTETVTIINKLGLHARAAAKFVQCANHFASKIEISKGSKTVNGKSIMGVMMLAASQGSEITITASGEDEAQAVSDIKALVEERFGEKE